MWHMAPLAHDETPEVVYTHLFVQGLTGALHTQVDTKFKGHLQAQLMTSNIQMLCLEEAIAVVEAVYF
jgi:hypothetical protein